jgi:hypothetical protein
VLVQIKLVTVFKTTMLRFVSEQLDEGVGRSKSHILPYDTTRFAGQSPYESWARQTIASATRQTIRVFTRFFTGHLLQDRRSNKFEHAACRTLNSNIRISREFNKEIQDRACSCVSSSNCPYFYCFLRREGAAAESEKHFDGHQSDPGLLHA